MKRIARPYEPDESELILGLYPTTPTPQIQEELRRLGYERTHEGIRRHANNNGVKKVNRQKPYRRWTEEEEDIIIEAYPQGAYAAQRELAKHGVDVSIKQIYGKAYSLGVYVGEDYYS